jgi:hypothetical protein
MAQQLPAGMRNNNPGNIKFVGQGDAVGPSKNTDQGDPQAVYATPQAGMRAMYNLLARKYAGGKVTPMMMIAGQGGWTPGNSQAAMNVAKNMGIGPNDDIQLNNPAMATKFMRSLMLQEHGQASMQYPDEMITGAITGQGGGDMAQTDPNWRPRRPGQGVTGGETGPMSPPADPNWRPARPGQQQSGTPLSPLTPPQIDPMQTQIAGGQGDPGYFPPAPEKKEGWRDKLAKMAAGYKAPAVALNDTTLAGMAMPKAARIDQGEVSMFDPNALANQRNQLAMAMQKLNTGKVWL